MNFEDHIMIVDDALSKEECDNLIDYYEWAEQSCLTRSRQELNDSEEKHKKDNTFFALEKNIIQTDFHCQIPPLQPMLEVVWKNFEKYENTYFTLKEDKLYSRFVRIQKTLPGEGYHVWHSETSSTSFYRACVWTMYLNDVEEGGETEFLFQHKRVNAKQGRLVIWPATYTHVHRGNPPMKGIKYIATGWITWT